MHSAIDDIDGNVDDCHENAHLYENNEEKNVIIDKPYDADFSDLISATTSVNGAILAEQSRKS